ncbi:hypothetical protein MRB53_017507 [Persea americana]|uniref:Uncharacterized protein n=1 Tax=Persea americana TaxID=3435 RepID=A0ACC2M5T1_PERAE|nr:hypothetical protein MRB53_017507 [Persea americana]
MDLDLKLENLMDKHTCIAHTCIAARRYGDGPDDELALESDGDYTRSIGYLKFSDYNNGTKDGKASDNLLNNVWYQPEEIFPVDGVPEERDHAFWVPVDDNYLSLAAKLEVILLSIPV